MNYQPKPKPIIASLRLFPTGGRALIVGRLYVGYVGLIVNLPGLIAIDLWFLKWQKGYPNA